MKVAMLTTVGDHCGIANYTRELVAELSQLVELSVEPIEPGKQEMAHYQAQAERLNEADLIHIQHEHGFWGGIMPGSSAFWNMRYLLKKPVVITAHTTYSLAEMLRYKEEKRLIHKLVKWMLLKNMKYRDSVEIAPFVTGECIVLTEAGRDILVSRGAKPEDVHVIPAGVPHTFPAPTQGSVMRDRFHLEDNRLITLFGFINPSKGYELALHALLDLPEEFTLVIAGGVRIPTEKMWEEDLVARIASLKLEKRVVITGFLSEEEIAEMMAATEVVIIPQIQATGSYSVMMAIAYAKPIVASDLACFKEIQRRHPCLRLFRAGDADHFTACLKGVLKNPIGQKELIERTQEYAKTHQWRNAALQTLEVYQKALATG
jgi:glycosyltransferase involved in cell wall biosynthesis